jgi:hypothetical protein
MCIPILRNKTCLAEKGIAGKDIILPAQDSLQMSCMFGVGYSLAVVWLVILFYKKKIRPGSLSRLIGYLRKQVSTHG